MDKTSMSPRQHMAATSILANYIAAAKLRDDTLNIPTIVENVVGVVEILVDRHLTDADKSALADYAKFLLI